MKHESLRIISGNLSKTDISSLVKIALSVIIFYFDVIYNIDHSSTLSLQIDWFNGIAIKMRFKFVQFYLLFANKFVMCICRN